MSDLLRMTGMYSGMDTESIVSQLVKTKSTKVTNLKNEQKKLEWKQTAWQDLNSKIYNMYSKTLSNLRLTSAYSKKSTVSSDSTKATVVASEGAVNGTQTLQVNKLAKSGYLTGAKLAGKTTTTTGTDGKDVTKVVNWETTDKLSEIDSNLTGKTISLTTGTGTDAKTTDIEITADMTINDLVAKFKDAGVNASFDTTNQRFFINSTGTGSAKNFTLSSDDSTALASLGLDPNATYTDINGYTASYLDRTLENKDMYYTIKEVQKSPGYNWQDKDIILKVSYDNNGKISTITPTQGGELINITSFNADNFEISMEIYNEEMF